MANPCILDSSDGNVFHTEGRERILQDTFTFQKGIAFKALKIDQIYSLFLHMA